VSSGETPVSLFEATLQTKCGALGGPDFYDTSLVGTPPPTPRGREAAGG
jgi:hypothetical protein